MLYVTPICLSLNLGSLSLDRCSPFAFFAFSATTNIVHEIATSFLFLAATFLFFVLGHQNLRRGLLDLVTSQLLVVAHLRAILIHILIICSCLTRWQMDSLVERSSLNKILLADFKAFCLARCRCI